MTSYNVAGVPTDKNHWFQKIRDFLNQQQSCLFLRPHTLTTKYFIFAGVPEWSNGHGSGPCGLVPTQVRNLSPALTFFAKKFNQKTSVRHSPVGEASLRAGSKPEGFVHPHFRRKCGLKTQQRFDSPHIFLFIGSLTMKSSEEQKKNVADFLEAASKFKNWVVIVEGKNDAAALKKLGFSSIIILKNGPNYKAVESVDKDKVIILTDLDAEGKKIYSELKKEFNNRGVFVDDTIRELLFRTELRQIEGLTRYLEGYEKD
jgi:5S rRNA maturation endonuclease (ribonuclease M5)